MKSNVRKKRIWAACLCFVFALTTAIGLLALPLNLYAEGDDVSSAGVLKFKQVAAGSDFAIGLTYDGDLYGWSLLPENELSDTQKKGELTSGIYGATENANDTLGHYYPANPIKINVQFRYAQWTQETNNLVSSAGQEHADIIPENRRLGGKENIVQIVATRNTAAFLTESGLIYTWGNNTDFEQTTDGTANLNLLMRQSPVASEYDQPQRGGTVDYFAPAMINYTNTTYQLSTICPGKYSGFGKVGYIAASEYNYMATYIAYAKSDDYTGTAYNNYIWGQSVYSQQQDYGTVKHDFHESNDTKVYNPIAEALSANTQNTGRAYLGDGNVYVINSGLNVKGKNFAVSKAVSTDNSPNYKLSNTFDVATTENGFAFASDGTTKIDITKAITTGFQVVVKSSEDRDKDLVVDLQQTALEAQFEYSDGKDAVKTQYDKFSAGAGYGYLINSANKVLFWGDGTLGQNGGNNGSAATAITDTGLTGIQVVAGKIITGKPILESFEDSNSAHANGDKWDTTTTTNLNDDYIDKNTYISAVLDSDGAVTAWGANEGNKVAAKEVDFSAWGVVAEQEHHIVYLAGGYGNNLFAISNYGKVFRLQIEGTEVKVTAAYDKFYCLNKENNVVEIKNWELQSGAKVEFTSDANTGVGYYAENEAYYSSSRADWARNSATVSLGNVAQTALSNSETDKGTKTSVHSMDAVSANMSGDAVRMIIPGFVDEGDYINYPEFSVNKYSRVDDIITYNGSSMISESVDGKPGDYNFANLSIENGNDLICPLKFYWSGDADKKYPLDPKIAFRYVYIEYRYIASNETPQIDFVITPRRSTGKQSLIIEYPIGRYDSKNNFNLADVRSEENAPVPIFYSVEYAQVEVKIANTALTPEFNTQFTVQDGETSVTLPTIPILDPNNQFNNTYSIALMDVSSGFSEVLSTLTAILGNEKFTYTKEDISNDLLNGTTGQNGTTKDTGFPAKSKIEAGNLSFYNKYATSYYTSEYSFLASDIDGDVLSLIGISNCHGSTLIENVVRENGTQVYSYRLNNIRVNIPLGEIDENTRAELSNAFIADPRGKNVGVPTFDNQYGFTFEIADNALLIHYQVITVTATASMSSDYVTYGEEYDISKPTLVLSAPGASADSVVSLLSPTLNDGNAVGNIILNNSGGTKRGMEIFVQSSLTFNANSLPNNQSYLYGGPTVNGKINTFTTELNLELDGDNTFSFNLADKFSSGLSRYFNDVSNIEIAYGGEVGPDAIAKYVTAFNGAGNLSPIRIADSKTDITTKFIKITAYREVSDYRFSLQLRRKASNGENKTFVNNGDAAETVVLNFVVKVEFKAYKSDYFGLKPEVKPIETVSKPHTLIDLRSYRLNDNITQELLAKCTVEADTSNHNILTVSYDKDNQSLVLEPVTSGNVQVHYKVTLFGDAGEVAYVIEDSFPVTVVMLVSYDKTVSVRGTAQVSKIDLVSALKNASSSTSKMNFDFVESKTIYQQIGVPKVANPTSDNDYNWTTYGEGEKIPFLRNVLIDDTGNYVSIVLGTYNPATVQDSERNNKYRVVVDFENAEGTQYKVAFRVEPAEQMLVESNGQLVSIEINKGAGTIAINSRGTNVDDQVAAAGAERLRRDASGRYEIPTSFFVGVLSDASKDQKSYSIVAAQAMSSDGTVDYNQYVDLLVSSSGDALYVTPLYPNSTGESCNIRVSVRGKHNTSGAAEVTTLNFELKVSGIRTVLEASEYRTILLASFFGVLALLVIVFFIRMGVYWKRKAAQRHIIKKNQEIIKMREKMHNKTEAVSKEKLVKTKLKMEDPKYAKMFTELRAQKEAQTGISLENSYVANKAERKVKAEKAKKKRGKMSLADLQAELEAKRESVARMQMGDFGDGVPADGVPIQDAPPVQSVPVEDVPIDGVPVFDPNVGFDGMSPEELDAQFRAAMEGEGITLDDNNGGEN